MDIKSKTVIDGDLFENMVMGGAANLHENIQTVNDLNVFPIPDGDTGTNMFLTMKGGLDQLKTEQGTSVSDKATALAKGMLMGARGNSGVILSQLFYGIAEELKNEECVTVEKFVKALESGVKCAYGAVAVPVEGTMLTVAREAAEQAKTHSEDETTVPDFFEYYLGAMKRSLEKTPELLAVLKEAGVIDSGGAGLVYITEGFCKALGGDVGHFEYDNASEAGSTSLDFSKFNEDSEMVFGYCTELLLQLQNRKIETNPFSIDKLIAFLETLSDSIVAFQTGTVVKIHAHTMTPYKILEYCQQFGEYLTVKIENMTLQHNETIKEESKSQPKKERSKKERSKYAVVTVAMGDGLIKLFKESGADVVINGGQTNNPSAESFVQAFDEVNADHIFVLPNNSNIILAAKQAAELYTTSIVHIIESKSVGQGYSAISMLDYSSDDPEVIESILKESIQNIVTGMVTKSVRTTQVNGVHIEKGDYMGFTDKTMLVSTPAKVDAVLGLVDKSAEDKCFITAVYGKEATEEEKKALSQHITANYSDIEFYEIEGGQDIYDFIMIME